MDGQGQREGGQEEHQRNDGREEIYSQVIRAGKRTYFFDIKATRANDYYLTITESKKRFNRDGRHYYEKHKLFLYKEDFDKFNGALSDVLAKIDELRSDHEAKESGNGMDNTPTENPPATAENSSASYTEVSFDDLGTE